MLGFGGGGGGTGFGAPATTPGKTPAGFGATATTGGFGAGTGTAGGFGAPAAPGTTGGFGAGTGTTGGFGAPAAPGTTGRFGAGTGTAGGFGAGTGTAGGFGAGTGATGGFGAGTGTAGGFGAPAATGTTGGFGAGTGTAGGFGSTTRTTGGFGGTSAGFGTSSMGFGSGGAANNRFGTGLGSGGQIQVPPYKGIKGPGFSTDWARGVNFSSLRDDAVFEELPPPLQQHLMELHNFIQAEHEAQKFLEAFLSDSTTPANSTSSYRELQKKLTQLTSGENAVDTVRVDCFEREVHAQQLSHILEKFEEEITQYTKRVWEPLSDQNFSQWRNSNKSEPPSELFSRCLKDIQTRMEEISVAVTELELALLPNIQRQKRPLSMLDGGFISGGVDASASALPFAPLTSGLDPLDTASTLRATTPLNPVAQMNSTLSNELNTMLNLASWTSRLHARADGARDLFAHLYGSSEPEMLRAQQHQHSVTGPKRPFAISRLSAPTTSDTDRETLGDIHRRSLGLPRLGNSSGESRRMQYDLLLERQRQPTTTTGAPAPATTTTTTTAAAGTTGFGVAAGTTTGGFGALGSTTGGGSTGFGATKAAAPTTGFGGATTTTATTIASAAPTAGFGAAASAGVAGGLNSGSRLFTGKKERS